MQLTNFEISVLWYIGSVTISRLTICAFLGIETSDIKLRISGTCPQNTKSIFLILIWNLPGYPQPGLAPGSRVFLLLSLRSEERRVGKECISRWSRYQYEKN